jgi:predicted phage-related endonuclease
MKPAIKKDLKLLGEILEDITADLTKFTEADLIDIAARLKPVAKHCKAIDDHVKDQVKEKLKHKEGTRLGELFKAVLNLVPTTRLDQKLLKEELPKVHAKYNIAVVDERVTFELR